MSTPEHGYDEPAGYSIAKGFVKSNPNNNEAYVEEWSDDAWYPAIIDCHTAIQSVVPNYNIAQIKSKFNGLRFYFDLPDESDIDWDLVPTHIAKSFNPMDELRRWCDVRVLFAEGWVAGYEYGQGRSQ